MKRSIPTRLSRKNYQPMTEPVRLPNAAGGLTSGLFLAVPIGFAAMVAYSAVSNQSLSPLSWYLARATGITLYFLFWGIIVVGLLQTTRIFDRIASKSTLLSLHTYLSQLAYAFLAGHVLSLVVDQHLPFSLEQLFAPFKAPTAEPWTGFGILAMYLFIVVVASASLRKYIPYRVWRFLHVLAFPMYALSLLHGVGSGASSGAALMQAIYLLTASGVALLCVLRVLVWTPGVRQPRVVFPDEPFDRMGAQARQQAMARERPR
ncbi:MAG TPA: ferric reductase-like transmembrane domain-containing protein [Thermomicrobiales bacterium]|nr:ferric reductase-like transmembrane domain-containing protein [Thermomicrobiales bacterium]